MSYHEPGMPGSMSPPPVTPPPSTAPSTDWSSPYPASGFSEQSDESSSTKDVAKQEASNVAQSATGAAQQVASTTKEQASNVASDVKNQAKQLAGQTRQELSQQASSTKDRAVSGLRSLSQELRGMTERSEESGPATQLAQQAAKVTDQITDFVEQREPGQLLDEVRDYARRRPGAFLLGAALAGVLVGRLTRGVVSSASSSDEGTTGSTDQGNGASTYGTPAYGVPVATPRMTPSYEPTSELPRTPLYGEGPADSDMYGQPAPTSYPYSDGPGSVTR